MATFTEKEFKSILIVRKLIDSWFWEKYGINPYQGCQFGCIYCDSRSEKYYLPTDFENDIIIKKEIGPILEKRIAKARTLLPDVVGLGGTTDCYQPAETKYENTRQCLEILKKYQFPVHILTKSDLVLRDLNILEEISQNNWCTVSVTITTTNSELARFLEPRAPEPGRRLEIIRTIKEKTKQIQAGVLMIPLIPFLSDSPAATEDLVQQAKTAGADYVLFGSGLTMRDQQAIRFLSQLQLKYPELIGEYETLYHFRHQPKNYGGTYEPDEKYFWKQNQIFTALCAKYQMTYRIKRYLPPDFRRENYRIAERLLNKAYVLQITGKAWSNLFWAGQNIQNLREPIRELAHRDELRKIRNVDEKIALYIKEKLKEDPIL